jgi:hypothetical protein
MRRNPLIRLGLVALLATGSGFAASALPNKDQIYEAANSGQLALAQREIEQVLQARPQSGEAHYVQAELFAREGNIAGARAELNRAEQLEPGLPFARAASVNELERQLAAGSAGNGPRYAPGNPGYASGAPPVRHSFPWGIVLAVIAGFVILLMILRRRASYGYPGAGYPSAPPPMPGPLPMQPGYGGPVMMPGSGSGLMGNLATGLAVGAGVAAGEELVHHVIDGNRFGSGVPTNEAPVASPENADMGGNDFGITDNGNWDDNSSAGGGGDDWGGGGDSGGGGGDWT